MYTTRSWSWLNALWRFSRPHTIIGTSLSVLGLAVIAFSVIYPHLVALPFGNTVLPPSSLSPLSPSSPPSWIHFSGLILAALFACLCGNVYIVGLNQLHDIEIDRINKPFLPLASGDFSIAEGVGIVLVTGGLALLVAGLQGPFLLATVAVSLAIGTAYSQPPVRLKRFPFWAALCIFGVRGVIVNLGLFSHFQQRLGGAFSIPVEVWVLTVFVVVFTFAIAIFKDMPDTEGDRRFHIRTLPIQLGQQTVFNLSRWVLTACYVGMLAIVGWLPAVQPVFMIVTHLGLLILMWVCSFQVNLNSKTDIKQFYQLIWKLFFLEYLIFPAVCLLGS